ncbi:phenylacetate-CoA oxygenase subunit PaaJ [Flavobacteriales bacterium]|nr:phenylacetate-CoA oxygenase subunit PaaJ [Flavobacteriales bacterium]
MNEFQLREILEQVKDPEVPVLSVLDLGVIRDFSYHDGVVDVVITPTYSGCPAMKVIEDDINQVFKENGISKLNIKTVLSPAWTTDWITEKGKKQLKEYGIAPPEKSSVDKTSIMGDAKYISCPQCNSANTEMISQFGSTACKALYKCNECLEPFDYFKCL